MATFFFISLLAFGRMHTTTEEWKFGDSFEQAVHGRNKKFWKIRTLGASFARKAPGNSFYD